jgi:hypothetical protein
MARLQPISELAIVTINRQSHYHMIVCALSACYSQLTAGYAAIMSCVQADKVTGGRDGGLRILPG